MAYDTMGFGNYMNNLYARPSIGQQGAMAYGGNNAGLSSGSYYDGLITGKPIYRPSMAGMETVGVPPGAGGGGGVPPMGGGQAEPPGTWSNPNPPNAPGDPLPGGNPPPGFIDSPSPPDGGGPANGEFKNFMQFFKYYFGDGTGSPGHFYSAKRNGPSDYYAADVPDEWRKRAYQRVNRPGGPFSPYATPGDNWGGWPQVGQGPHAFLMNNMGTR